VRVTAPATFPLGPSKPDGAVWGFCSTCGAPRRTVTTDLGNGQVYIEGQCSAYPTHGAYS